MTRKSSAGRTLLDVVVERAVAGGRMLARHDGRVVLVADAIPGERVRVEIERVARGVLWARTVDVLEAAPARRPGHADPACGGQVFSHIRYEDQCRFKAEIVADAFRRIGRMTLPEPPVIDPSPEQGYRLRTRLRLRHGRAGFFREGTHTLCDAAATGQLLPATMPAIERLLDQLGGTAFSCESLLVAENVAGTERVVHLEQGRVNQAAWKPQRDLPDGITGLTDDEAGSVRVLAGSGWVRDTARDLFQGDSPVASDVTWSRRPLSFFQGNRFLTGTLVRAVMEAASGERIADLYAGVGLFTLALASRGASVLAVEDDRWGSDDLVMNAAPYGPLIDVRRQTVESLDETPRVLDTVIVDPPRTGLSTKAVERVVGFGAPRVVYVSCDPATLARDAAALGASRYELASLRGFDLFPNTAHVECLAVFEREGV